MLVLVIPVGDAVAGGTEIGDLSGPCNAMVMVA